MKEKKAKSAEVKMQTAMFGGGCFWGVEEAFRTTPGVTATEVGYGGGSTKDTTYEEVCSDETGHAEVVKVAFDPKKTNFKKLLTVFWKIHDPTQMNRQGPDVGMQYRSIIFYFDNKQKKEAEASLKNEQKKHTRMIATAIEPAGIYVKAEDYHQKYLMKRGAASCHI